MTAIAHSATCSGCGQLYADEESGDYLFTSPVTLARLMDADGWTADPPLCPPCQPVRTPPPSPAELEAAGQLRLPGATP